ncbi:SRPBCC family protein [Jiangella gansuensis]|uniref:SRPBCC family protein n=1 Tax=Jiangella gansuensis TaxID=281473 RepID=UPI0004B50B09|nr:SRPBCC domain-containing protein [Jiangella gansuensis]
MNSDHTPTIRVTVAAPVDEVWRALRSKDRIRHWHGWDSDSLDAEIDLIYFTHFVEDADALTLSVQEGDQIVLEPDGDRTRITLTRAPRGVSPEWDAYYDDITEGWTTFLQQLRFHLERQPRADRRTVFVAGHPSSGARVVEALGLSGAAGLPEGSGYSASVLGEPLSGEVWFRSENQVGFTVDGWGPGLLVLTQTPADGGADNATAVLSTFGLDDARYTLLAERWTAWWAGRYPAAADV